MYSAVRGSPFCPSKAPFVYGDHVFSVRPFWRHLFRSRTFSAQIASAPIRCSLTVHFFRVRVSKKHRILAPKRSAMKWSRRIVVDPCLCTPFVVLEKNCKYILFTKLPWSGDSKGTLRSSSQAATCPPCLPHTVEASHFLLITERQAGKL